MTTPKDFEFLDATVAPPAGNGNGSLPPPMSESEITGLLQYVPHGQMHEALKKLGGHFAALLGPDRQAEIQTIIGTATAGWEQPVDPDKVRSTVADMIELERQKRAARDEAPPYDDRGFEETVVDVEPEAAPETTAQKSSSSAKKAATPKTPPVIEPYKMLAGPAFMRATFAGATRLVPRIGLTECGAGLLTGSSGDGKSVCGLNLALAWTGTALPLGTVLPAARPLRVMVFQVEDTPGIVQERLKLMGVAVPENLILFTRNEPIHFSGAKGKPNLMALARLKKTLEAHTPIDVVIFDPLIYLHEAEENSASEMMRWLEPFREVCREAKAAPFVIHHAGWAVDGDDARGRGTTAIRAWSDLELTLRAETRNGRTLHRLNLKKTNFAPRWPEALALEFDLTTLIFRPVDADTVLCAPEALVTWLLKDHDGEWTGKRGELTTAICQQFKCERRTAERAVTLAKERKLLSDHGRGKPLEVAQK